MVTQMKNATILRGMLVVFALTLLFVATQSSDVMAGSRDGVIGHHHDLEYEVYADGGGGAVGNTGSAESGQPAGDESRIKKYEDTPMLVGGSSFRVMLDITLYRMFMIFMR